VNREAFDPLEAELLLPDAVIDSPLGPMIFAGVPIGLTTGSGAMARRPAARSHHL